MKIFTYMHVVILIQIGFCKPPIIIPPQNPNDPVTLPKGVTKSVLIIGKIKKTKYFYITEFVYKKYI